MIKHDNIERSLPLMVVMIVIALSWGGMVEIVPLFFHEDTTEAVEGLEPYTALQLEGRDIYIREGCHVCHTQMVRPFRAETERYGPYSVSGESVYEHPFLWGSKRTGPDLARVGGKYSDDWHVEHLKDPRALVPASIMPGYPFLAENRLNTRDIESHLTVNTVIGVPYTEEQIANAASDILGQARPDTEAADGFEERWPNATIRDFDGNPREVTEMDALVAYLQVLGTMVDFSIYDDKANAR